MGGYLCLIHAWWKCICISRALSAVGRQYGKPYGQRLIHEGFSQTNTPVNAGLLVVMNNLLVARSLVAVDESRSTEGGNREFMHHGE